MKLTYYPLISPVAWLVFLGKGQLRAADCAGEDDRI